MDHVYFLVKLESTLIQVVVVVVVMVVAMDLG